MALPILNHVWKHSPSDGSDLLALLYLSDRADDNGFCYPGIAKIGEYARTQERATQRIVNRLVESGQLRVYDQFGIKTSKGRTNLYQVVVPWTEDIRPIVEDWVNVRGVSPTTPQDDDGVSSTTPLGVSPTTPYPLVYPLEKTIPKSGNQISRWEKQPRIERRLEEVGEVHVVSNLERAILNLTNASSLSKSQLQKISNVVQVVNANGVVSHPSPEELFENNSHFQGYVLRIAPAEVTKHRRLTAGNLIDQIRGYDWANGWFVHRGRMEAVREQLEKSDGVKPILTEIEIIEP